MKFNPDSATPHRERMIKVCGNCNPDNIRSVSALTPMMMGFIFTERSPRNAMSLDPDEVKSLPDYIVPVAVFMDADIDTVIAIASKYGITHLQLHGSESPLMCSALKRKGYTVFKTIAVGDSLPVDEIKRYDGCVDMIVFDTLTPAGGGSGKKFDWSLLEDYPSQVPYLIGGGVGPDDIDAIVAAMRPLMAGIDINSRFESAPGVKDIPTLTHFILSLRKYNENEPSYITF